MKYVLNVVILVFILIDFCFSQEKAVQDVSFLFHGVVMDTKTLKPVSNTLISINGISSSASGNDGTFSFFVNKNDSVLFMHIGYKPVMLITPDTLSGHEFVAGIYMSTDTISIAEVVILPRYRNLKSEILKSPSKVPSTMDNARYNIAISAYQGKISQAKLGDPVSNYNMLSQKQKTDAFEKGGVPSDKMVSLSPFMLVPAAYLLIHGLPEKPASYEEKISAQELEKIQKAYLKTLEQKK